jgi:hypothetical protein
LCGALLLLATPAVAEEEPAASALTITITPHGQEPRTYQLTCDPDGGDHPDPARACARLGAVEGRIGELRPGRRPCGWTYRPYKVDVRGSWQGRNVSFNGTYPNPCLAKSAGGGLFPSEQSGAAQEHPSAPAALARGRALEQVGPPRGRAFEQAGPRGRAPEQAGPHGRAPEQAGPRGRGPEQAGPERGWAPEQAGPTRGRAPEQAGPRGRASEQAWHMRGRPREPFRGHSRRSRHADGDRETSSPTRLWR